MSVTAPKRRALARGAALACAYLALSSGAVAQDASAPRSETSDPDQARASRSASAVERPAPRKSNSLASPTQLKSDSAEDTPVEGLVDWSEEDLERIKRLELQPELNRIQFYDRESVERLQSAWKSAPKTGLSVVHVGDSHVQNGAIHRALRDALWPQLGNGGYGLLFPYSAAKTYSPRDYRSEHSGRWTFAKSWRLPAEIPLGVSGMSVRTRSPWASVTLTFRSAVPEDWRVLRIYCERDSRSFDLKIDSAGKTTPVRVRPKGDDERPYVEVVLPKVGRSIRIRMRKRSARQKRFELHGMSLQSVNPGGLVVHNAGVGAARFRAILHEEHFESHLNSLNPQLVIVEYGTNDYLYDDQLKPELEGEIRTSIARIRRASPDAMILLVSAQDLYRREKNLTSGVLYSDLLHRIAAEEKVAVFDWYWVSGGGKTLRGWRDAELARKDLIHLTPRGYRFKGRLLARALEETMRWLDQNPEATERLLDREPLKRALAERADEGEREAQPIALEGALTYRVKPGECLAGIATRHGVTAQEIMTWNRMKSRKIHAGRELQLLVASD